MTPMEEFDKLLYRHKENIVAVCEYMFTRGENFVEHCPLFEDRGMDAAFEFIIAAADAFSGTEPAFGQPSEDYDWVKAIEEYCRVLILEWEHMDAETGRVSAAKKALSKASYSTLRNVDSTK